MTKRSYKRIRFDEALERILIFNKTSEKRLLQIIKGLKDVFPKQKFWKEMETNKSEKEAEILIKFQKRGKLYREICKSWINANAQLGEDFNSYFQNLQTEVQTENVIKFFDDLKTKYNLKTVDIVIFIHIFVEQVLGVQLFEESATIIEKQLDAEGL